MCTCMLDRLLSTFCRPQVTDLFEFRHYLYTSIHLIVRAFIWVIASWITHYITDGTIFLIRINACQYSINCLFSGSENDRSRHCAIVSRHWGNHDELKDCLRKEVDYMRYMNEKILNEELKTKYRSDFWKRKTRYYSNGNPLVEDIKDAAEKKCSEGDH